MGTGLEAKASSGVAELAVNDKRSRIESLYLEHWHEAARLAYFITGDSHLAEEIAQESLIRVLTRLPTLRREDAFRAYLARTVINRARTLQRRQLKEQETLRRTDPAKKEHEQPDLATRDQLWAALHLLPERQKIALVFRYCEDMSEAQVAEVMRTSPKAVKSLITRGLTALRRHTEELR